MSQHETSRTQPTSKHPFADTGRSSQADLRAAASAAPLRGHLLGRFYRTLSIDAEWCEWTVDGFRWWPFRLAQRISVTEDADFDGITAVRLVVETDVSREVPETPQVHRELDRLNREATLSALARHDDGRVTLSASMVPHPQNLDWMWLPAAQCAGLQPQEAARAAAVLTGLGAKPAESGHPVMGEREEQDEMNYGAMTIVWQRQFMDLYLESAWERLAAYLNEQGIGAVGDNEGLMAEIPFGSWSSLLRILSPIDHPRFGKGVLCLLSLPVGEDVRSVVGYGPEDVAKQLNLRSSSRVLRTNGLHCLGAWVYDDLTDSVTQATFLPAGICSPEVAYYIGYAIAAQALELGRELGPTLVGQAPPKTAFERLGRAVLRRSSGVSSPANR
jgi:hypothetical protein